MTLERDGGRAAFGMSARGLAAEAWRDFDCGRRMTSSLLADFAALRFIAPKFPHIPRIAKARIARGARRHSAASNRQKLL